MHKTALVAFSKDPTRSEVKTRLSEKFSKADRVSIYTALLEDFLAELTQFRCGKELVCRHSVP